MMKINWGFRPKLHDEDSRGPGVTSDNQAESHQHPWTYGASMSTRVIVGVLWAALLMGPLALAVNLLSSDPEYEMQQASGGELSGEAAAVSDFAIRAVVAWLETPATEESSLTEFFGNLSQARPELPWVADRASVAQISQDVSGLWSVVVGVDVAEEVPPESSVPSEASADIERSNGGTDEDENADEEETSPATPVPTSGRMYFRVPVLYHDGALVAQALPALVPEPMSAEQIDTVYTEVLDPENSAYARIENFLSAVLVTGDQADIEAYSSPGTDFRSLNPISFTEIRVDSIRVMGAEGLSEGPSDGEQAEVQATLSLIGTNQQELIAQYSLLLVARQNRWEVAVMRDVPLLAAPVPNSTPTLTTVPDASETNSTSPTDQSVTTEPSEQGDSSEVSPLPTTEGGGSDE